MFGVEFVLFFIVLGLGQTAEDSDHVYKYLAEFYRVKGTYKENSMFFI